MLLTIKVNPMENTHINIIDEEFEAKYTQWLKLAQATPLANPTNPTNSFQPEPVSPITQEPEINQIVQAAKLLGAKGYEFELILEPRCSYKKILVTQEYYPGPFKISTSEPFLKPLELETYVNFDSIYSAVKKVNVGIHCKYNAKNMLIFKSKDRYYLGFRCHKCNSFNSNKQNRQTGPAVPDLLTELSNVTDPDQIPQIEDFTNVNINIFCRGCHTTGLDEKERYYNYEIEQVLRTRVNKKSLSLEYSSGGSLSIVHNLGTIYPVK